MASPDDIPQLISISRNIIAIDATLPVGKLYQLFQEDPSLLSVPVMEVERFLGVVNRKGLFNLMSRPFTMELYAKRPVSILLQDIPGTKIVMESQLDINDAIAMLLAVDPNLETDAFPIVADDCCVGIIAVSDLMMAVSENQKRLLETLNQLSTRIREEVAKASKIQLDLLPHPAFQFHGITVGAGVTTSSEIGGDFYDYFTIGDHRLGLVIADVSGHGVQSGMVTTAAKASLHTLISLGATTPAELLAGMSNAILATARQTLLMTCFIAVIDVAERTISFANAGHNFPYLYRKERATLEMLDSSVGFPLGFERDSAYQEFTIPFAEGDTLFLYTDGILECVDGNGDEFGYARLENLLQEKIVLPAHLLHSVLLDGAAQFTGTRSFADDVTTLVASFRSDYQQ